MENKMIYTEDEQIVRIWDVENVRHTMNRLAHFLSAGEGRRVVSELFVTEAEYRRTASLGVNIGYYKGLGEVARFFVLDKNQRLYENLKARSEADPSIPVDNLHLGFGCQDFMTLTTPVIRVSDDGRFAQYMGYYLGYTCEGKPDGTAECIQIFGRAMADLVKEPDGSWRIWHMIFANDHSLESGSNYADYPVNGWPEMLSDRFGEPTEKRTVYDGFFGWEFCATDMPKEKYYTYTDKQGYGPDSDIGRPYYER